MITYHAGLVKSPWNYMFTWQFEKYIDDIYCEAFEVKKITAQNRKEAAKLLNKEFGKEYRIRKRPLAEDEKWW